MKTAGWKQAMVAMGVAFVGQAGAQVLDLPTVSSANLADESRFTLEAGLVTGHTDYTGLRGTFKPGDRLALGLDLGSADISGDKLTPGGFAMYQLDVEAAHPIAVKGGYLKVMDNDVAYIEMTVEVIMSGDVNDRIGWVAHAGVHKVDINIKRLDMGRWGHINAHTRIDDIAPAVGGGLVYKLNDQASVYVGLDLLLGSIPGYADTYMGGGFRWSFK